MGMAMDHAMQMRASAKNSKRDSTCRHPRMIGTGFCQYKEGRDGHLFATRAGRLLDSRNLLEVLHRAGKRGVFRAFRRFRFAVLRKAGVPGDLMKLWLGHSQNLINLYAGQLRYDEAYRRGSGVRELAWDLSWANWAINRSCQFAHHSSRKPFMRQVLENGCGGRFEPSVSVCPSHHDAVDRRGIRPPSHLPANSGKIGDRNSVETTALHATMLEKDQVIRAREPLLGDCVCFEPCIPKD